MTGSENKVEEDKKPPTRYPDYIIILNMCGLQICFGFVYAVIAPFLPIEVWSLHFADSLNHLYFV